MATQATVLTPTQVAQIAHYARAQRAAGAATPVAVAPTRRPAPVVAAPAPAPRKAERGLNQCNFLGRLGADPKMVYTSTGLAVTTVSLAVQSYPNAPAPDWIKLRFWRGAAETFNQYARKGSKVHITGKLRTGSYTDRAGVRRTSAVIDVDEFLFLGDPGHQAGNHAATPGAAAPVPADLGDRGNLDLSNLDLSALDLSAMDDLV